MSKFDPFADLTESERDALNPDDLEYLKSHREAFKRQLAARGEDDERKKAALEHMRSVKEERQSVPGEQDVQVGKPAPVQIISIMIASPDVGSAKNSIRYAPDWATMKEVLAKLDGTWTISRHVIPVDAAAILGFFGKDGWSMPDGTKRDSFEAIVKSGRVFRADPE